MREFRSQLIHLKTESNSVEIPEKVASCWVGVRVWSGGALRACVNFYVVQIKLINYTVCFL